MPQRAEEGFCCPRWCRPLQIILHLSAVDQQDGSSIIVTAARLVRRCKEVNAGDDFESFYGLSTLRRIDANLLQAVG